MSPDPLVLLHGWGMNPAIWSSLPDSLAAGRERCALALPGHAGAPWQPDWTRLPDWADACLAQAPEQAIWLGWSLGGLVALQAARQASKRVKALILISSTPRFTRAVDWQVAMPEETLAQFHSTLLEDTNATLQRFLTLQVRGSDEAPKLLKQLRLALKTAPVAQPEALGIGLDLLRDEDLRGPLPDIRQPTLWLFGERDTLVPAAVAKRITILHPQAQVECLQGAGHAPFLSHAQAVSELIHGFLSEVVS
ncbi:pimeloyl-ACP methyl ester esterase BioH [Thiorhodovibrio frisius]|uniref:Putative pimeloyl-BioC--CoA transferase BioH n=1 Tax=Thiorhodovibrio frisius TaxID=631362 RepID=H8YXZ2_9GAMM|nr:pimeloyl-ACP methyl ester esterase BioH [Thiorhodovibrio frisius]EIC23318.1 putative pimeloyl-BioC--CoA transferase BioH [Thiorhodovibrio frisius]WPL23602.1 Pimelyl-[acyl-carrier protein] methyl ester esterase [Thiorhodovibrio frisius]